MSCLWYFYVHKENASQLDDSDVIFLFGPGPLHGDYAFYLFPAICQKKDASVELSKREC